MAPYRRSSNTGVGPLIQGRIHDGPAGLARELGTCVYFLRTDAGLIKIGYTTDLTQRHHQFGAGWTRVLAVIADGTLDLEREMHERFAAHLADGREYFHPATELIDYINEIRGRLGVSPIAA